MAHQPQNLRRWAIEITEIRPSQYSVTLTSPNGDQYTTPRILGAMNVLVRVQDFIKRFIFMTEV